MIYYENLKTLKMLILQNKVLHLYNQQISLVRTT